MTNLTDHELARIIANDMPGYRFVGSATTVDAAAALPENVAKTPDLATIKAQYSSQSRLARVGGQISSFIAKTFGNFGTPNAEDQVMVLISPDVPLAAGEKPHVKAAVISQKDRKVTSIQG